MTDNAFDPEPEPELPEPEPDVPAEVTVTTTLAEPVREPLVPVTVTVYWPADVPDGTLTVSVDEPAPPAWMLTDCGLNDVLTPDGSVVCNVTLLLKELTEDIVTLAVTEEPVCTVRLLTADT